MAVKVQSESGQSLIEFLLLLPAMVGLVFILVRVNTAIQISIVNQQYARAQVHFITYNSSVYPDLSLRTRGAMAETGFNQILLGISENNNSEDGASSFEPVASTHQVTRRRILAGGNEERAEPDRREMVRVRTTVTLCTQSNFIGGDGNNLMMTSSNMTALESAGSRAFQYCAAPAEFIE